MSFFLIYNSKIVDQCSENLGCLPFSVDILYMVYIYGYTYFVAAGAVALLLIKKLICNVCNAKNSGVEQTYCC